MTKNLNFGQTRAYFEPPFIDRWPKIRHTHNQKVFLLDENRRDFHINTSHDRGLRGHYKA